MRITATVAEQLRLLHEDPDRGDEFAAGLHRLSLGVALAVPSTIVVSIFAGRLGGEVDIGASGAPAPVLASLAVPLSAGWPGDRLILRAGRPGAYLLLADDLNGRTGSAHPPAELDEHLFWPRSLSSESLAQSLADLDATEQAVGVLVDRGFEPEEARLELRRRGYEAAITTAATGRRLLASFGSGADNQA